MLKKHGRKNWQLAQTKTIRKAICEDRLKVTLTCNKMPLLTHSSFKQIGKPSIVSSRIFTWTNKNSQTDRQILKNKSAHCKALRNKIPKWSHLQFLIIEYLC